MRVDECESLPRQLRVGIAARSAERPRVGLNDSKACPLFALCHGRLFLRVLLGFGLPLCRWHIMERGAGEHLFWRLDRHAFGDRAPTVAGRVVTIPANEQQMEFAASITSRDGGNALLKPLTALSTEAKRKSMGKTGPAGQERIVLRNLVCPAQWGQ